jgi:nucleoside-diphosphate-sugar epimerase
LEQFSCFKRGDEFEWLRGKTCVVTGGAGFIGSNLVRVLVAIGASVRVVDNFLTGKKENLTGIEAKVFEGSVTDPVFLKDAFVGAEYVFHLAAIPSVPRSLELPTESCSVNILGTQLVLESARQAHVKRVIYSASSSAYGDTQGQDARNEDLLPRPLSPYAAQKLSGEYLMRAYALSMGLDTVSLRYFNIFGPRQDPNSFYSAVIPRFIKALLADHGVSVHGDGDQSRDFTFVDNAVLANLLASRPDISCRGEVVNVGCGDSFSLLTMISLLESISGKKLRTKHEPSRAGDVKFSRADISKTRRLIGYEPCVSFRDGLERTYLYLRDLNHGAAFP